MRGKLSQTQRNQSGRAGDSPAHPADYFTPDRFRHEYGRLVAWLSLRLTRDQSLPSDEAIQSAQDIAQDTLLAAMRSWPKDGLPSNPSGWLTQVAKNRAIDQLRRNGFTVRLDDEHVEHASSSNQNQDATFAGEIGDDLLRMLFACCHPSLSVDAQLALTLHVVAGFSAQEIAKSFLADERTIAQRIVRAKKQLREHSADFEFPIGAALSPRIETVLRALYLLFNEGYLSAQGATLTRPELCREAQRLLELILSHEYIMRDAQVIPGAEALMALFQFQLARIAARINSGGELVLLEEQDRSKYDQQLIVSGFAWLDRARRGQAITTYHLEALILSCHVRAVDLQSTDWHTILESYDALMTLAPSPVVQINRVVAYSFRHGPRAGLAQLEEFENELSMQRFHLFHAVRGDLLRRLHRNDEARTCFERALELTDNLREQEFLKHRIETLR